MSDLVTIRKIVYSAEITHVPRVSEDDNQNNKQPKENRPTFHINMEAPHGASNVQASARAPVCRAFHASHTAGRSDTTIMPITTMEK